MVDWSGYTQGPDYKGLIQSAKDAGGAVQSGMDTAFSQGLQKDQNARAWDQNSRAWDDNKRANIVSDQNQQLFPYKVSEEQFKQAQRAQTMLGEMGGMAQDASTPEEWNLLLGTMKQRGIDTSKFEGDDWNVGKRKLQIVTGETNRRLAQEMQKAKISETQSQGQNFASEALKNDPYTQQALQDYSWQQFVRQRQGLPPLPPMQRPGADGQMRAPQAPSQSQATPGPQGALPSVPGIAVGGQQPPSQIRPRTPIVADNAGDITASAGAVKQGRGFVPDLMSPEDEAMLFLAQRGQHGAAALMRQMPGQIYRDTAAKQRATDDVARSNSQANAEGPLQLMDDWKKIAESAGPDVLAKATGPFMNEEKWQKFRQTVPYLTEQAKWDQAYNVNIRMQHMKEMLGAQMKMLGQGGGGTDQQQTVVMDAVGKAMHASNPETFFAIMHDATNGVKVLGKMPLDKNPDDHIPQTWRERGYKSKEIDNWSKAQKTNTAPSQTRPSSSSPKSKVEYDALPPGTLYAAPDGSMRTKPSAGSL